VGGVNRILWVLMWVAGCHLGRPPATAPAVSLGELKAAVVEPGLRDALGKGLADALATRGMLASSGAAVSLEVREASTRSVAADGAHQVKTVRLEIVVSLVGPPERSVVLSDERSYALQAGRTLDAASARAAAFAALAQELTDQAATWIRYAPTPESP